MKKMLKVSPLKAFAFASAAVLSLFCTGCEEGEKGEGQYVDPGAADVRGTWYEHGSTGGWFGPNNEWGFSWYYISQHGTNLNGTCEYELYS